MYLPNYFADTEQTSLFKTIRTIQIANLVTQHTTGLIATLLPFYLAENEAEQRVLYGHIAKANSQWQEPLTTTEALAIFTGPDAYISPTWLPSKKIHHKVVPTWDYTAVQVYGTIEFIEDRDILFNIVSQLTSINEQHRQPAWQVTDAPADYIQAMLRAIIGVKLTIHKIAGKRKLSQNKPLLDQQGIAAGLANTQQSHAKLLAKMILNNH